MERVVKIGGEWLIDATSIRQLAQMPPQKQPLPKSLALLFEESKKKFPNHRDFPVQAAKALTYFAEAETDTPLKILKKTDWKEVKRYFSTETPKVLKTHSSA